MAQARGSFEVWTEYPYPIPYDNGVVSGTAWVELEVKLTCEPDETVQDTDWWISGVHIRASERFENNLSKIKEIEIPKNDPLHMRIVNWAGTHKANDINDEWQKWLSDQPRSRRRA